MKNLNKMSQVELLAMREELTVQLKAVEEALALKAVESVLVNKDFLAAWEEGWALFLDYGKKFSEARAEFRLANQTLVEAWDKYHADQKVWEGLSLEAKAKLADEKPVKPKALPEFKTRRPAYVLIRHDAGQDTTGWEGAANHLLNQWKGDRESRASITIKMGVRKPTEDPGKGKKKGV